MNYIKLMLNHFNQFFIYSQNFYLKGIMWPSSIDLTTGTFPNDKKTSYNKSTAIMPKGCTLLPGKRAYRYIDAPHGSSIYWDQPMLVALSFLSSYDNNNYLKGRAEDYITFFLQNCTAKNGAFLWGNHYYYDFNKKGVVFFEGDEEPKLCDSSESGLLHEIRPFSPAWELFWNVSGEQVKKHIYFMAENHVFNSQGGFNRHADKKQGCAFLEAGGILAESLCYLYRKTNDKKLVEQAKKIADYSWSNRNKNTNLVENNPTENRWDKYIITTEVALWANSLLRSADYSGENMFIDIAKNAVWAFLNYAYDKKTKKYYGKLYVESGKPCMEERTTLYQPKTYSDLWEYVFPSHDYLISLGKSAVKLYILTGEDVFYKAIIRIADIIERELKNPPGCIYAEQLGKCIWFLLDAKNVLNDEKYKQLAKKASDIAVSKLWRNNIFRTHTGEDIYSSVDGLGYLFLSLIYLQTGKKPDCMGFGFA